MVELVPFSDTLRKIQVEYGVTGSFKDKPLAEWLRKYNPAEDEYEKVKTHKVYVCTLAFKKNCEKTTQSAQQLLKCVAQSEKNLLSFFLMTCGDEN